MKKIYSILILGALAVASVIVANTGSASLDRPRVYDTGTNTFSTTLADGDPTDGIVTTAAGTVASAHATAVGSDGRVYAALVKEEETGADTHIYLQRSSGNTIEVWDNNAAAWTTTLANATPIDSTVAQGLSASSPAIALDSNDNVYVAFVREGTAGGNNNMWLSKLTAAGVLTTWDDGATSMTTNLAAPTAETDSIGRNSNVNFDVVGSPAIAIDSNDDVYIAFRQNITAGADGNAMLNLVKFDVSATDVLIWDDSSTSLTNDLTSAAVATDSFGLNIANHDAVGDPAIAIDSSNDVWVAYAGNGDTNNDNKIWLMKFDVSATDALIWDDGATSLTNVLTAPTAATDSFSRNDAVGTEASATPAMGIDSNGDIYVAYVQEGVAGANNKVYLSKFDVSATDAFVWDDGATSLTNVLTAPDEEADAFCNTSSDTDDVVGNPALVIDSNDDVWVAVNQASNGDNSDNQKPWLVKFDVSATDALIWDDGATSLTNVLSAPAAFSDSIGPNDARDRDSEGSPSIALAANGDIYVAYNMERADDDKEHIFISKFDVSAADALIWDDGATSLTNVLTAPTAEADAADTGATDFDAADNPVLTATSNGIYYHFIQDSVAGSTERAYTGRWGAPSSTAALGRSSSSGSCLVNDMNNIVVAMLLASLGLLVVYGAKRSFAKS